jgi:hypothetical protein
MEAVGSFRTMEAFVAVQDLLPRRLFCCTAVMLDMSIIRDRQYLKHATVQEFVHVSACKIPLLYRQIFCIF